MILKLKYRKAYHILEKNFRQVILKDMDVLANEDSWKKILQLIPDEGIKVSLKIDVKRELEAEWQETPSVLSTDKWECLVRKLVLKEKEKKVFVFKLKC